VRTEYNVVQFVHSIICIRQILLLFLSVQFALRGQKRVRTCGSEYETSLHFSDVFLFIHLAD